MAWEYLDDLNELTGSPGSSSGNNTTWEKALEALENDISFNQLVDDGDTGIDGEYNKFFDGYNNHSITTIETSWGLTITYNAIYNGGVMVNWTENETSYNQGFGSIFGKYGIRFAINRETEQAILLILWRFTNPGWYTVIQNGASNMTEENKQSLYRILMNGAIQPITWSSVPKISGSNKTYRLTDILNINDGNAVEDEPSKGNVDFSKKTKINTLVEEAVERDSDGDITKATVKYDIPEGNYQYTKLVFKKKKIPKSASDGTIVDIGMEDNKVVVTGLEENTTYYFVVFTNKTRSEAYKYRTGAAPIVTIKLFKSTVKISKGPVETGFIEITSYEKRT